jgi:hypothetical protein
MKYPRINNKELSTAEKRLFTQRKRIIKKCITSDNEQNEMGLSRTDIKILSWNIATYLAI